MGIKVFPTLHLFAAQHVCSGGCLRGWGGAPLFVPIPVSCTLKVKMFSCRCDPGWVFLFFFLLRLQSKTKQTEEDAVRLTASYLNVPEGSAAKQAKLRCLHTSLKTAITCLPLPLACSFSLLSDPLVLSYTDVAGASFKARANIQTFNQQASRPLSPTAVDYGLADLLKLPWCQSPWWVGVITSPVISWLEQQRDLNSPSSAIRRREIDGFICERSDGTTRADIHSELIRGATLQASRQAAAAAFRCAAACEGAGIRLLSCPVHKIIHHKYVYPLKCWKLQKFEVKKHLQCTNGWIMHNYH